MAGWDPDEAATAEAVRRGAIDRVGHGPHDYSVADVVFLTGPLAAIMSTLTEMTTDALVTDVAGVKVPILAASRHLPRFVGGHPMAGGATRGPDMASPHLFHGAAWMLSNDGTNEDDLSQLEEAIRSLGANPLRMTAAQHDSAVARISHLPHLLAAALTFLASRVDAISLAGGGFRDLTRVSDSDAAWWPDVLDSNSREVVAAITELQDELESIKAMLDSKDHLGLDSVLDRARRARSELIDHHAQVRVVLFDQPGELARVGHALESSQADVRDIQLRHGEHGGGGVLTISVSKPSAAALCRDLVAQGFTIEA